MLMVERRKHRRLPVRLNVVCQRVGSSRRGWFRGFTKDVGTGGVFFESNTDSVGPGELLKVQLSIPPTRGLLDVGGRIGAFAKVVRGSSSRRGGEGFRKLCRWAERGASLCVAPDGPKGPKHEVKEGTIYLAQKTGLPILPVSYRAKEALTLKSWDGFVLPLPFTSVEVKCSDPIHVPSDLGPEERKSFCSTLRDKLMDLE